MASNDMDDKYIKKIFLKGTQRAKILVATPGFQKEVLIIRKKFNIPLEGLKDQESNQKWYRDFYQSESEFFRNVWGKRRHEISELKEAGKFIEAQELTKELNNTMPINALRITIKNILQKYKLPLNWEESIRRYILFNNIDSMWLPGGIYINVEYDQDTGLHKLSVEIQDDTTLEDIKKAWPDIEFHQKHLHSYVNQKFQPIKKFDRDKRAYELQEEGKTIEEIGEIINLEFDDALGDSELKQIIKRYKKRLNIN